MGICLPTAAGGHREGTLAPQSWEKVPACKRCGSSAELLTALAEWGHYPAYRIFGCSACTSVEWVAERVTA